MPATLAYSYVRFSNPDQIRGDSLRRQSEAAADWCRRHGLTLDTSLTLHDLGVSAFRGRNAAVGNLRTFLDAVEGGRVPPGSTLIVESFDRISRQGIDEGYDIVKSILKSDVRIVTLSPEREFDREATRSLSKGALEIQLILERAAEESERKSGRVAAAWAEKRDAARRGVAQGHRREDRVGGMRIITHRLPGWLREEGGKAVLVPERAKAVRQVYRLALEGRGPREVATLMNAAGVKPVGRARFRGKATKWKDTAVAHLLTTRAAVGEFQPCQGGKPAGPPIPRYFPAVVSQKQFDAVQGLLARRAALARGRKGGHVNLFAGLLRDAADAGHGHLVYCHTATRPPTLVPAAAKHVNGHRWSSFPAGPFEQALLSELREVPAAAVAAGRNGAALKVEAAAARVAEVDGLVAKWQAKMDTPDIVDLVAGKLSELAARRKELAAELAEAQQAAASPLAETWGSFRSLAALLAADDSPELRERVRAALRQAVEVVYCVFVGVGRWRLAGVQVFFRTSTARRDYVVAYHPGRSNQTVKRPGGWSVRSFAAARVADGLDLRRPDHARRLERFLEAVDLPAG
jgi:DNA invertase Pin-like site-specific DNA recombinase